MSRAVRLGSVAEINYSLLLPRNCNKKLYTQRVIKLLCVSGSNILNSPFAPINRGSPFLFRYHPLLHPQPSGRGGGGLRRCLGGERGSDGRSIDLCISLWRMVISCPNTRACVHKLIDIFTEHSARGWTPRDGS